MPVRSRPRPDPLPAGLLAPAHRERRRQPATTPEREHHVSGTALWQTVPPLATGARDATQVGICALAKDVIRPGQRIADLVGGRGVAHTSCIARVSEAR